MAESFITEFLHVLIYQKDSWEEVAFLQHSSQGHHLSKNTALIQMPPEEKQERDKVPGLFYSLQSLPGPPSDCTCPVQHRLGSGPVFTTEQVTCGQWVREITSKKRLPVVPSRWTTWIEDQPTRALSNTINLCPTGKSHTFSVLVNPGNELLPTTLKSRSASGGLLSYRFLEKVKKPLPYSSNISRGPFLPPP